MNPDPIADNPERAELRATVQRLVADVAPPERVAALDVAEQFDDDLFVALADLGAFAVGAPPGAGGSGDVRDQLVVVEELAAGPTSMAAFAIAHFAVTQVVGTFGRTPTHHELAQALVDGRARCAFALSEPGGGTDVARAMQTRGVRDGESWRISGQKMWTSGAATAQHVVVLNMPGITNTPRFQMVLDGIAAANGGGTAGAAARANAESLFKSWIGAFNSELAVKFNGNSSVVLVDFYTSFNDQIASPAQYLLSNVTTPACPSTGTGSDGLLTYSFSTCTDAALSAMAPPAGSDGTVNWWKSYAFSDSFHPTPYGHDLLARRIMKSLAEAGWY